MNTKYNVLVWAEDAGKFAKECQEKGVPEEVKSVIVLGSELKIGDLKILKDVVGLCYDIDNEYSCTRSATEIFMLGRCLEQSNTEGMQIGLAGFSSLSKEALEVAKNAGIPVANWSLLKGKPTKKRATPRKKEQSPTVAEKAKTKAPTEKKLASVSNKTQEPSKTADKLEDAIQQLIIESNLSASNKEFFATAQSTAAIAEAVRNASDANIGLPFQLQMRFGSKGAVLEGLLSKNFTKLRA